MLEPMKDLRTVSDRVKRWRAENRLVSAALFIAGDEAAGFFVRGEVHDDSEFRMWITGWGRATFHLIGSTVVSELPDWTKEATESLSGQTIDWPEALIVKFPSGNILTLWSGSE